MRDGYGFNEGGQYFRDFPGGPTVKTPCFQYREHGFSSQELRSYMLSGRAKINDKMGNCVCFFFLKIDTLLSLCFMVP